MDIIISVLAAEGIPAWILRMAMKATGLHGGARLTTALSALGPGGMIGGMVSLLAVQAVSFVLSEVAIERIYIRVVRQLCKEGYPIVDIMKTINEYPVSGQLKERLKREVAIQLVANNY